MYYKFDIVGNLPLELVCLVFSHLEVYMAFSCRRVSKYWAKVLSSSHLVRPHLRTWFMEGVLEALIELSNELSKSQVSDLAGSIDAFQNGRPFAWVHRSWDLFDSEGHPESFNADRGHRMSQAYSSGKLAWIRKEASHISIVDVNTGEMQTYLVQGMNLSHVTISETFVVAFSASDRKLYTYHLETKTQHMLEVPANCTGPLTSITVKASAVVSLFSDLRTPESELWILVCTLDDLASYCFLVHLLNSIPALTYLFPHLLFNTEKRTVTLFFLAESSSDFSLNYAEVELSGTLQAAGCTDQVTRKDKDDSMFYLTSICNSAGLQGLITYFKSPSGSQEHIVRIFYDRKRNQLQFGSPVQIDSQAHHKFFDWQDCFLWKSVAFANAWSTSLPQVTSQVDGRWVMARNSMYLYVPKGGELVPAYGFHCDETYVVQPCEDSYQVFYFDPRIELHGGERRIPTRECIPQEDIVDGQQV